MKEKKEKEFRILGINGNATSNEAQSSFRFMARANK